jgi:hypothetical protein
MQDGVESMAAVALDAGGRGVDGGSGLHAGRRDLEGVDGGGGCAPRRTTPTGYLDGGGGHATEAGEGVDGGSRGCRRRRRLRSAQDDADGTMAAAVTLQGERDVEGGRRLLS